MDKAPHAMRRIEISGRVWFYLVSAVGACTACAVWLMVASFRQIEAQNFEVARSHAVIEAAEGFVSTLKDAETGERGYIITGDPEFLQSYRQAEANYQSQIDRLRRLLADDRPQAQRAERLAHRTEDEMAWLRKTTDALRSDGIAVARSLVASKVGKRTMDALRGSVAEITTEERRRLVIHTRDAVSQGRRSLAVMVLDVVALGTLLLTAALFAASYGRTRRRLDLILSSVGDGFIILDRKRRVTHFNAGAEAFTNRLAKDVVGRPVAEALPAYVGSAIEAQFESCLASGKPSRFTTQSPASGASMEMSAYPAEDSLVVFFHDVSERMRLVAEIRTLNATLERRVLDRTAQLDGFCYTVAHDMRMHIRGVNANVAFLKEDLADLADAHRRHLDALEGATVKMARLVDDLLAFARATNDEVRRVVVDLSKAADAIAFRLVGDAPYAKDAEFVVAPGLVAHGDPQLIGVVLENLLDNACKFRHPDRSPRVEVGHDGEAFFVRDNGRGFDQAYAPKVFLPFERLHSDPAIPGSGIGLANVQRILLRHGGTIAVESTLGVGATFTFTFGAAPPTPRPMAANAVEETA